ncbi:hypothetical protein [Tenacibaculum piscium]|uniref:hypothetical protein n=1 Tax=Tenacibaculum piscium TaxID=1458515 RepID=UPI001F2C3C8B|nr:hypothetical protein [Tenacibaculum piscium]
MKKGILLLVLLFITTLGFSQNKIGGNDPIPGIDIIIKKNPGSKPIANPGNEPLIDQMNKLEFEYLNLKAREVQYGFANQDLSKLKTQDEIFKEYIVYLKKKIAKEKPKMTKAISYGSTRSNKQEGIINTEKKPTLKKAVKANVNTSRSNKKEQ